MIELRSLVVFLMVTKQSKSHSLILVWIYIFICWINSGKLINHTLQLKANKPTIVPSYIDSDRITKMPTAWLFRTSISHTHSHSQNGTHTLLNRILSQRYGNLIKYGCFGIDITAVTQHQVTWSGQIMARTKFELNTNFRRYISLLCHFNHRQFQAVFTRTHSTAALILHQLFG